jgi:hypothetical protein
MEEYLFGTQPGQDGFSRSTELAAAEAALEREARACGSAFLDSAVDCAEDPCMIAVRFRTDPPDLPAECDMFVDAFWPAYVEGVVSPEGDYTVVVYTRSPIEELPRQHQMWLFGRGEALVQELKSAVSEP